jgi:magnesium transporter
MNFELIPELKWTGGYPFAIAVDDNLRGSPLFLFKRKGWL